MAKTKDISIGENRWIKWIEFNLMNEHAILDVDDLFNPTLDLWNALEINCVAECCGMDAFVFWEEDVRKAIRVLDQMQLAANLKNMKQVVMQSSKTIISCGKLNSYLAKDVFIELIDHVLIIIEAKR